MSAHSPRKCLMLIIVAFLLLILMLMLMLTIPSAEARRRHRNDNDNIGNNGRKLRSRGRNRDRERGRSRRLGHPTLLSIPAVYHEMNRTGKIFRDTYPDHRWVVDRIDHSKTKDNSCNEVVYATLVLNREPHVVYHRTCDGEDLWSADRPLLRCRTTEPGVHTYHCEPQVTYHIVRMAGRERYQETFTGCVCSASKTLSLGGGDY
ncbi:uncharacterized protein LOC143274897 [Babylonia areolata]|uniref:uncharacterized protein LOC143274897 n=1 Tax=Babylonia areolata TaxID=304850 RepID=UPI003FD24FE4